MTVGAGYAGRAFRSAEGAAAKRPVGGPRAAAGAYLVALCAGATALSAQAERASDVAGRAGELLSSGDTARALVLLRERVREDDQDGRAWLDLGRVLAALATEAEADIEARLEAKRALERAATLLPADPTVLLEYGLLLRKQQVGTDAVRVLNRAWDAAEKRGVALPPPERARMHFELARLYESWWLDWDGLIQIPNTARAAWSCGGAASVTRGSDGSGGLAPPADDGVEAGSGPVNLDPTAIGLAGRFGSFAVLCPRQWWDALEGVVSIEELKDADRNRMLGHYRLALQAQPDHVPAATALLGHLADAAEWGEYEAVAQQLLTAAPEDPWAHLFLGLGRHEQGNSAGAAAAFERALRLLPEDERAVFLDLELLVPEAVRETYRATAGPERRSADAVILSSKDPLYLTAVNERELEHYARVAWAELKFSAPAARVRGWDTEVGRTFIRYGRPVRTLQCCYGGEGDLGRTSSGERDHDPGGVAAQRALGRARFHYWSYGPSGPNFYFWRFRTRRLARPAEGTALALERLARSMPELYVPRNPTAIHPVPLQIARFLGSRRDLVRVELYAAVPLDSLGVGAGDSLQAGVFLFDAAHDPVWERRHGVEVGERGVALTYRVELPESSLRYAVEARAAGPDSLPRPAARAVGPLEVEALGAGLAISDLLLADRIDARVPAPASRDELTVVPNRGLRFEAQDPLHIYFEVYGLRADDEGLARYRAQLAVTEVSEERRGVLARVFGGARDLLFGGDGEGPEVRWERTVPLEADRAIDFLRVELPELEPGRYSVALRISDSDGRAATRERTFVVVGRAEEDD